MNVGIMHGHFQIGSLAKAFLPARCVGLGAILTCLLGIVSTAPVFAMVGPAREAPEFAPYVVVVLDQTGAKASVCSASVVTRNVVLTAAHCVSGLAATRVYYRESSGDGIFLGVAKIAINPNYRPDATPRGEHSIDLALLLLTEPLPSKFKPVELGGIGPVAVGQHVRIAGFGLSDEDKARIASFGPSDEDISGTSGVLRAGVLISSGPKSTFAFLIDPAGAGLGACVGDSGAPVFAGQGPRLVAVAIQANAEGGHKCGETTVAVQLAPQMPWIRKTLRAWGATLNMAP
ncbi:MAG: trypsin-like serine protease [Beijerinckiaceae bacterium]